MRPNSAILLGDVCLLLSPTFCGPVVLQTKDKDYITLLPHLVARTRTLRASDRETTVRCFGPSPSYPEAHMPRTQTAEDGGDRCFVSTQHGKVIVGISGLDVSKE